MLHCGLMALVIRDEQMRAFEAVQRHRLVRELRAAFLSAYPERCRELGPEALDAVIRLGLEKAPRHGLASVGECTGFIDLMLNLSPEFDTDPAFAWARQILEMPKLRGAAKIARIQSTLARRIELSDGAA